MTDRSPKKPRDVNVLAADIVSEATDDQPTPHKEAPSTPLPAS